MRRFLRAVNAVTLVVSMSAPAAALSPSQTVMDWLCADAPEREVAARVLTLIAGQGRHDLGESYFVHCIDDVAYVAPLQTRTIGAVAAGCALMTMRTHAETD